MVACTPSHFLACSCIILISSSVVVWHSPCVSVCPNPPLLSFRKTPFTGFRWASETSFKFDYICKISFPSKITPFYHHTNRDTRNHERDPQVPCRREFRGCGDPKQYSTMSHDLSIKQQHYLLFLCHLSFDKSVCLSAQRSPSASLHAPYIVSLPSWRHTEPQMERTAHIYPIPKLPPHLVISFFMLSLLRGWPSTLHSYTLLFNACSFQPSQPRFFQGGNTLSVLQRQISGQVLYHTGTDNENDILK